MTATARQPAGIPVGGEFAPSSRPASGVTLDGGLEAAKAGRLELITELNDAREAWRIAADRLDELRWADATGNPVLAGHAAEARIAFRAHIAARVSAQEEADFAWAAAERIGDRLRALELGGEDPAPGGAQPEPDGPLVWRDADGRTVYDSRHPDIQAGGIVNDVAVNDGVMTTTFSRSRPGAAPREPYAMRFQANRPLTSSETAIVAALVGYAYRAEVRGEAMDLPAQDTPYSFIVGADTTKSRSDDLGQALQRFEAALPALLRDGSPVRTTDRAGAGTKGTRLVPGLRDPNLKLQVYYDDVIEG